MSSKGKTPAQDLIDAMTAADVMETFDQLPGAAQKNFLGWVSKARDDISLRRRIDALVLAMRMGLLYGTEPPASQTSGPDPQAMEN